VIVTDICTICFADVVPVAATSLDFKHVLMKSDYNGHKSYLPNDDMLEFDAAKYHLDGEVCK
jgi:hypothetical protein